MRGPRPSGGTIVIHVIADQRPDARRAFAGRGAPRLSSEHAAIAAAAAIVGLSAAFVLFPGADLAVSDLFHRSQDGFFLAHEPALRALRKSSTLVTALMLLAALGRWAWHCHLMFHMDAGMFREVVVS